MSAAAFTGRVRGHIVFALAAVCALILFALPAMAREEIRSFRSDMALAVDGTASVTETIEVTSEGRSIRRGIFRDIPTVLVNEDGSRQRSDLTVISVMRDGRAEPFAVEGIQGGTRIRIGDPDVLLSDGPHRYVIQYTLTRMARFFPDHDEFYMNATGNYWEFPILQATANVTLPEGAVISDTAGFTGPFGSTSQNVSTDRTSDRTVTIRLTQPLAAYEGMSFAVAFQKGVLAEPDGVVGFLNWLSDHRDVILPVLAVLIVLGYYLIAWNAVGRDPEKGTIIPLFHAPKGYSPALVHFIHNMGWKQSGWTAFTAALFDLGVRGLVTIDNVAKTLTVTVTGKEPEEKLPAGEQVLFAHFRGAGKLTVDKTTGPTLNKKRGEFISTIEGESRQAYFRNNYGYVALGFLISVLCLGAMVLFGVLEPGWAIVAAAAGLFLGLFSTIFKSLWSGAGFSKFFVVVWIVIALVNVSGSFASFVPQLLWSGAILGTASIVLINVVFAILMRAPTLQGRRIMDQIDGFKMYIRTAEENRLNMTGEPPMTVERFERILPYAIALGVEKPWSKHFEGELARNAVEGVSDGQYRPGWYYGGTSTSFSPGKIANSVSSAAAGISAAMIAAQPASSSSSGFSGGGGGGFSGGGGGGGGGGGW